MKKRLITSILAIVLVFSVTSVALATSATFSATKCRIGFTTAASVSTEGTYFSAVAVKLSKLTFTPSVSPNNVKILGKSVTTGGVQAGTPLPVYLDGYYEFLGVWGDFESEDSLKIRFDNPNSGTNAQLSGNFTAIGQ